MISNPSYDELLQMVDELRRKNNEMTQMLTVARAIPMSRSFQESARQIYDACKAFTGAGCGYVALMSDDGKKNEVLFLDDGGLPCGVDRDIPMPIRGLRSQAYKTGDVVYENNFTESEWSKYLPQGHVVLFNVLFAPLNFAGRSIGVMGLANKPGGFTESDAQIAGSFGDIAALSLRYSRYNEILETKEKINRELLSHIPNPVLIIGPDRSIRFVNKAFEDLTGFTAREVVGGSDPYPWWPEPGRKKIQSDFEQALHDGAKKVEEVFRKKSGDLFTVEIISSPALKDGSLDYYLAIWVDITERQQAEKALQDSAVYMQSIFRAAPTGIGVVCDRVFVQVNDRFCNMMGYPKDELIGKPSVKVYPSVSEFEKVGREKYEQIKESGTGTVETVMKRKDGSLIDVLLSSTPIDQEDLSLGVTFTALDITQMKKMEENIRESQKMESIGNLAGGIAHDFNNILFPIIGMSEMLMEDLPAGSMEKESAEEIYNAGIRGKELVGQILAFSRQSEHKKLPLRIQNILKEVLKLLRSTIPSDIEIIQHIQNDCGMILADPTQIHQIAMNLITNASHAVEESGKTGEISIGLEETFFEKTDEQGDLKHQVPCVAFTVSDNGYGIDPVIMDRLFDPYFTTKEKGKGTGLGLAVVYGIVKEHQGEITIGSEPGKGTLITVFLPLLNEKIKPGERRTSQALPRGTEHILLVDDEPAVMKLECQMLERLGYQVTSRVSSTDALEAFTANPDAYDLVMTDMTMPNLTGDQLARKLMSIKPDLPVIICTGFSERINRKKAELIGIKHFLMKPVVYKNLAQTIRNVLDHP